MRKIAVLLLILALVPGLCVLSASAEEAARPDTAFPDSLTWAFPLSARRAICVENEIQELIHIYTDGKDQPILCCVVPEDTARVRLEISAADDPAAMVYEDLNGSRVPLPGLLDSAAGAFVYEQQVAGMANGKEFHYNAGILAEDSPGSADPAEVRIFLLRDIQYIHEIEADLLRCGEQGFRWEKADLPADTAEPASDTYIIHIADQYSRPVPYAAVSFCTDTSCVMAESDENGTVIFTGAPENYHILVVDAPEGYSYNEDFAFYTGSAPGEWVLRIQKD